MEGKQSRTRSSSSMWYCRSSASIAVLFGDLGDRGDLAPVLLFARGVPLAILTFPFEIESKKQIACAKQQNRSRPGSNRRPRD